MTHVTRELLDAWDRGEVSPEELSLRYQDHALELCPTCRDGFADFLAGREKVQQGRSFRTLYDLVSLLNDRLARWDEAARKRVQDLAVLPAREREEAVLAVESPIEQSFLAEQLLDASLDRASVEPEGARALARLAFHVALRLDPPAELPGLPAELRTRALALEANALRAGGELTRANPILEAALEGLEEVEPTSRALVLALAASLRRAQRRLQESIDLSDRAYGLARDLDLDELAAQTLIGKSYALSLSGCVLEAVQGVRRALRHIDPQRAPRLYLCARHDQLLFLVDAGRAAWARRLLARLRPLYDRFPDANSQLRRRWLEGRIAQALDEPEAAERALGEVREGFIEIGNGYNAALAALDLAVLYAHLDRRDEMKRLAEEMIPIFRAQDVHREALAALLVFCNAASRDAVSHDLLHRLVDYLRRARDDRELRFES